MSSSNTGAVYELTISASDSYKHVVRLTVFDSVDNKVSSSCKFPCTMFLKKGLYTIRIELSGEVKDTVIALSSDQHYHVGTNTHDKPNVNAIMLIPPPIYTSALLLDGHEDIYKSSHEYYSDLAADWASKNTMSYVPEVHTNSSLFIFLRFPTREIFEKLDDVTQPFYRLFELLDESGNRFCLFEENETVTVHDKDGWVAFNAELQSGLYFLKYKGKHPRQIPIFVYRDWHTQFFMTLGAEPLFGTIRVFLNRWRQYDPMDKTNKYIDIFLDKLHNNDMMLEEEMIDFAANEKFESPMLGLLCAYIYLSSPETRNDWLFSKMVSNLQHLILKDNEEAPDLRALNIIANKHFGDMHPLDTRPVKWTPMFRIGFEAIRNAAVHHPDMIAKNSLNDLITENIYSDSPFNTFRPVSIRPLNMQDMIGSITVETTGSILGHSGGFLEEGAPDDITTGTIAHAAPSGTPGRELSGKPYKKGPSTIKTKMGELLFNKLIQSTGLHSTGISWITFSVADLLRENSDMSVTDVSKELSISPNTIDRVIEDFIRENESSAGDTVLQPLTV